MTNYRLARATKSLMDLLTIAEHGSLNRAAEASGVSQPALTQSINKLESIVRAKLLERTPAGITPTAAGKAAIAAAVLIKDELSGLLGDIETLRGKARVELRVGATSMMLSHVLAKALDAIFHEMPSLEIKIIEGQNGDLIRQLEDGEIDLIVGTATFRNQRKNILRQRLFKMEFNIVASAGHPAAALKKPTLEALARFQWILPRAESGLQKRIDTAFKLSSIKPMEPAIEISSPEAIKSLIRSTELLAVLPAIAVRSELSSRDLIAIPGPWLFETVDITAFYRVDCENAPGLVKMIEQLRNFKQ